MIGFSIIKYLLFFIIVWGAISFSIITLGYLTNKPSVIGKDKKGRIPIMFYLLHVPFHLYNKAAWVFNRLKDNSPIYHHVFNDIIIGRRCSDGNYPKEVEVVVDLTSEFSEFISGKEYVFFPILDDAAPPRGVIEKIVDLVSSKNSIIYIHCAEGRGRAGMIAAALVLAKGQAKSVDEAINVVKEIRPCVQLKKRQKKALERYARELF